VFFFGGVWTSWTYRQFARQSTYLASRGMVAASAEYRIRSLHNDAAGDDLSLSSIPGSMVLFNPGLNPSSNGREILDSAGMPIAKAISHNLFPRAKAPSAVRHPLLRHR